MKRRTRTRSWSVTSDLFHFLLMFYKTMYFLTSCTNELKFCENLSLFWGSKVFRLQIHEMLITINRKFNENSPLDAARSSRTRDEKKTKGSATISWILSIIWQLSKARWNIKVRMLLNISPFSDKCLFNIANAFWSTDFPVAYRKLTTLRTQTCF